MSTPATRIKDAMTPVLTSDFMTYIEAACESISELDALVRDTDNGIGWSSILDVDRVPAKALPWLAQLVGVITVMGISDAEQRARVKAHGNWKRGSPDAIKAATQLHLTGTKTVILRERFGGSAWQLVIVTRTSETPNPTQTLADILEQKPAGVVLTYNVLSGQDFESLYVNHPDFADVYADYLTFEGVVEDLPGT